MNFYGTNILMKYSYKPIPHYLRSVGKLFVTFCWFEPEAIRVIMSGIKSIAKEVSILKLEVGENGKKFQECAE